jgi:hypothetical protein
MAPASSSAVGSPEGIRTPDLFLEREAPWTTRRPGRTIQDTARMRARKTRCIPSPDMSKWVRPLSRPLGATGHWHLLDSDKDFVVANSLCGEKLPAALEVTLDEEKAERDGRCPSCAKHLDAKQEARAAIHRTS